MSAINRRLAGVLYGILVGYWPIAHADAPAAASVTQVRLPSQSLYCIESFPLKASVLDKAPTYRAAFNALEQAIVVAARTAKLRSTGLPHGRNMRAAPPAVLAAGEAAPATAPPMWIMTVCSAVPADAAAPAPSSRVKLAVRPATNIAATICGIGGEETRRCRRAVATAVGVPATETDTELEEKHEWMYAQALAGNDPAASILNSFTATAARAIDPDTALALRQDAKLIVALHIPGQ